MNIYTLITITAAALIILMLIGLFFLSRQKLNIYRTLTEFKETIQQALTQHRSQFDERQLESLKLLQDSLNAGMSNTRKDVTASLQQYAKQLTKQVDKLTHNTDQKLKEISGQVEKRLSEGLQMSLNALH